MILTMMRRRMKIRELIERLQGRAMDVAKKVVAEMHKGSNFKPRIARP